MARGLTIICAPTTAAVRAEADRACADLYRRGVRCVRLMPDATQAALVKQRLADDGTPFLGETVSTLAGWVQDRWMLFGDGRPPVTSAQRRALVLQALAEVKGQVSVVDADAPGMPRFIESTLREAMGSAALAAASGASGQDLGKSARDVLLVCSSYTRLLKGAGLSEPGEEAALLPSLMGAAGWSHLVLDGVSELSQAQIVLVAAAAAREGATLVVRADAPGTPAGLANPALALSLPLIGSLTNLCSGLGIPVERLGARANPPVWKSPELGRLAQALFRPQQGPCPIPPADAVRFALPAGAYAEPEAIASCVIRLRDKGVAPRDVAVVCQDPLPMAESLSGRLALAGIACMAKASTPLAATSLGRAVLGLAQLARHEGVPNMTEPAPDLEPVAADLARNPALGLDLEDALRLDRRWRNERITSARDFLRDLKHASDKGGTGPKASANGQARAVIEAYEDGRLADMVDRMTGIPGHMAGADGSAEDLRGRPAWAEGLARRREQAAASTLKRIFEQAAELGSNPKPLLTDLVADAVLPDGELFVPADSLAAQSSSDALAHNPNAVRVMGPRDVEGLSFRAVVVCGLNGRAETPPPDPLGIAPAISSVDEDRWRFSCALEAAREVLVLERTLFDEAGNPCQPSTLFEEVVDCYRDDITSLDDLDSQTGLPQPGYTGHELLERALLVGEEGFASALDPIGIPLGGRAVRTVPAPQPFSLESQSSHQALAAAADQKPLSPSSLEAYLRCPARWFYERRLPSSGLDAAFDPLSVGSFCHSVLKSVHDRLPRETNCSRITPEIVRDPALWWGVESLYNECFDDAVAYNRDVFESRGLQNRLVVTSPVEGKKLAQLRRDLMDCLRRDASFPAAYAPRAGELAFGQEGSDLPAVPYAGALLAGCIDRVDADTAGNALVIDYKGSLEKGYEPADGAPSPVPLHSQVLMYATALNRLDLGLYVTGAFYLSYTKPQAKAFVSATVDPDDLTGFSAKGITMLSKGDFADLLQQTEEEAAQAVRGMREGDISPNPRFGRLSCDSCPMACLCPERRDV